MSIDLSLELRKAVVAHLRGDANITTLVPSAKIYGEFAASEDFPFIRIGYASAQGFDATGPWNGSESDLTIHVFADGPGTDAVMTIAKRVVASMANFAPVTISLADCEWLRTDVVPDVVAGKLHAIVVFRVVAVSV